MPRRHPQAQGGRSGPQVAVGYLRRSTDRQEQSIPDQRKAIERYAAEHDLEHTRDDTPFLEKHAREALNLLETDGLDGKRISVASTKADGTPRRKNPPGTTITFSD